MKNYYFVAPSLPTLVLGEIPELTFEEVIHRLELNLTPKDLEKVKILRLPIDLQNIRALYEGKPLDPHGNLNEKELDEALLVKADLPEYVFDFLGQFEETSEAAAHFFGLISRYYSVEIPQQSGFLKALLLMQREMRLVLAAQRAKKLKRDITIELQFEDFTDPLVAEILAQRDMSEYEPPTEYRDLFTSLEGAEGDPWRQYQVVVEYEFDKIDEMTGYPLFSLDWILGFVARLMLVEKWNELDDERGEKIAMKYKTG